MANLILAIFIVQALAIGVYPGIKNYIGQDVFVNFKEAFVPTFVQDLKTNPLPNTNYSVSFFLTKMQFRFHDMWISELDLTPSKMNFVLESPNKILLEITNITMSMTAKFNLEWFGNYTGNISNSVTQANLSLPIIIGTEFDVPYIKFQEMKMKYQKMLFKFKSTNAFLSLFAYTEYIWPLNHVDEYIIHHALLSAGVKLNPIISKFLKSFSYNQVISSYDLSLNYHFLSFNVTSGQSINLGIVGGFLVPSRPYEYPPQQSMNSSISWVSTQSFRMQITDYFFNSLLWGISTAGYLNITVSNMLPQYKTFFTTNGMRLVVPQLENTYGPNFPVNVNCGAGHYPSVSIDSQGIQISSSFICVFTVMKSIIQQPGFTIQFTANSQLGGYVSSDLDNIQIYYQLLANSTVLSNFVILSSAVGTIDTNALESAFNFGVASVVAFLNPKIINSGFTVPIPDYMSLVNPTIYNTKRAIELGADTVFQFSLSDLLN